MPIDDAPRERSVLISGASIAGPAFAYWMSKYGWSVTIVERAEQLRDGGQNIDVRGAGREVARRMGLEEAIRSASTGELGTEFVRGDGSVVAAFPASTDDTSGATAELEILRGDLAQLLVDSVPDDVEFVFGDSITGVQEHDDDVEVSFASGSSHRFDLVVIAEGINSRTRTLVFGNAPQIKHLGLSTSYLSIPRTDADTDWARWYNAPGMRSMTLRPDNRGTIRATLSFVTEDKDPGTRRLSRDEHKDQLRVRFGDAGWEAPRVLEALDGETDLYYEDVGQVHAPSWTSGRVALLGDAGYCASPISGMGTSLALVGAYVLAGEIAAHVDRRDAFRGYERIMRPYVEQAQKLPPGTPRIAHPKSKVGLEVFRAGLKVMASKPVTALGGSLISPPADKIDLPDYSHLEA